MKKILLILFAFLFSTSLIAHSPPQFNSKDNCRKKLSMLKGISKLKGYGGGEIIKFNSYTGFDQRTVLLGGHKNNHIEITGLTTWVYDNEQDTRELSKEVKRINFQLYHIDKNKIPTQRFFNFLNNISEKKISLGVMCNDYEFTKTITNSVKKSSKITFGYFLNSNCSKST